MSRLCDLIKIINCSSSFKFKRTSLPPSHRSHEPYATLMDAKSALFFNRIDIAPLYPFRTQDLITPETCHGVKMPSIKEMASFAGVNKFSFLRGFFMRDEMIPVKKHQIWFLTKGRGIERELLLFPILHPVSVCSA
jgi:hypothetical protein